MMVLFNISYSYYYYALPTHSEFVVEFNAVQPDTI